MRSLTSSSPWWSASRISRAAFRSVESSVVTFHGRSSTVSSQVRIQPPSGLCSLRALQLADLAQRGLADLLGQVGGLDAGPVVVGTVGLALAELLADRGELLAQQEFLLRLLHAVADVLGDLVVDLDLGQVRRWSSRSAPAAARPRRASPAAAASARRSDTTRSPAVSASADGSVSLLTKSMICHASRRCSIASSSFLYSAASARVSSVGCGSSTSVTSTHSAAPGPVVPVPMWARRSPRTTAAEPPPPATRPTCTIDASTP